MTLAEKIIERRKMLGMSQEELAEMLGVSRQSVSKWELGSAMPETDKIAAMSEIFGVSCDYLLKDGEPLGDFTAACEVGVGELTAYLDATVKKLRKIAIGVMLFILSPLALILLGAAMDNKLVSETVALSVGLSVLFLTVAVGVAFVIFGNMQVSAYDSITKKSLPLSRGAVSLLKSRLNDGCLSYTRAVVAATVLCIVAVVPLVLLAVFELPEFVMSCGIAALFVFVCIAVYLFITFGSYRSECERLLEEVPKGGKEKVKSNIENAVWPIAVAVYLAISFTTGRWDITWIVFPITAALAGCIGALVDLKK